MTKLEKLKEQYENDKLSDVEKAKIKEEIEKEEDSKYTIISNGNRTRLLEEANEHRKEGWIPSGGLTKLDGEYTQVLYR